MCFCTNGGMRKGEKKSSNTAMGKLHKQHTGGPRVDGFYWSSLRMGLVGLPQKLWSHWNPMHFDTSVHRNTFCDIYFAQADVVWQTVTNCQRDPTGPEPRRHWATHAALLCPKPSTTSFLPGARASSRNLSAFQLFKHLYNCSHRKTNLSHSFKTPLWSLVPRPLSLSPPLRLSQHQWVSSPSSSV